MKDEPFDFVVKTCFVTYFDDLMSSVKSVLPFSNTPKLLKKSCQKMPGLEIWTDVLPHNV